VKLKMTSSYCFKHKRFSLKNTNKGRGENKLSRMGKFFLPHPRNHEARIPRYMRFIGTKKVKQKTGKMGDFIFSTALRSSHHKKTLLFYLFGNPSQKSRVSASSRNADNTGAFVAVIGLDDFSQLRNFG
jgi:hypothetical protein